jgi:hypothetical protein
VNAPKETPLAPIVLAVLTVLVAALQITASWNPYFGYDEAWHLYLSSVSPLWKALEEMAVDPHPPLYYLLLRPLTSIGPEPFWPRLLSVVPTILTVPLWYAVLRKLNVGLGAALAVTVLFAMSHSLNELGLSIRAYAPALFCVLAALWFWCDLVPGTRGRPSRRSLAAFLVFTAAAFWFAYYAVFVTAALIAATLAASLADPDARLLLQRTWRDWFRWPQRIAFAAAHLLGAAWFVVGVGRHGLAAPPHVSQHLFAGDAPVWGFLLSGLRGYLELFTPLAVRGEAALTLGIPVLAASLALLIAVEMRRRETARAALLLTLPVALSILAVTGFAGLYPFGGYLRHQHLLFPFLVLVLAFALDLVYRRLPNRPLRIGSLALVLAISAWTSARAWRADPIGEAPPSQMYGEEIAAVLGRGVAAEPLYVTVYPFYVVYAERFGKGIDYRDSYGHDEDGWIAISAAQDWLSGSRIRREWDEYLVASDSGERIPLFRDRTLFELPEAPDAAFFQRLNELMDERGLERLRVLRPHFELPMRDDGAGLSARYGRHGFRVSDYRWSPTGVTWLVERRREPADPTSPPPLNDVPGTAPRP